MAIPASAQYYPYPQNNGGYHRDDDDHDRDRDRDRNRNNGYHGNDGGYYGNGNYGYGNMSAQQQRAYQIGVKDAQWDQTHTPQTRNRRWKSSGEAAAYRDGYYNTMRANGGHNNGRYPRRGGNYPYGNYPYGNGNHGGYGNYGHNNVAAQQGYSAGSYTGRLDAQQGHSYRPTEWKGYKEADQGHSGSGMNKAQYQSFFRQAYIQGYRDAYNRYSGGRY